MLKVNLWTDKQVYKAGEPIFVTYSLEHVGSLLPAVYLHYELSATHGGGEAGFRVDVLDEHDREIAPKGWVAEFLGYPRDLDLVRYIQRAWILLRPGYFYGRREQLRFDLYEPLKNPGRYKLVGTYYNITLGWLTEEQKQVLKKLDCPIWAGQVVSDPVWIEIVK